MTHTSPGRMSARTLVLPLVAGLSLLGGGVARAAPAQWAVVTRNVNLRAQPSTDSAEIVLLHTGTELELVWPDRVNRYYLVLTEAGEIGWAWGNNVRLASESEVPSLEHFPRERGTTPPYDRDRHFGGWTDHDADCQDTRAEVLVRDSDGGTVADARGCRIRQGRWPDPYSDEVLTAAADVDIDHFVPLKNAYESGAWRWSYPRRAAYANYLQDSRHLLAVKDRLNQSKGDRGPDRWLPPSQPYLCTYVREWVRLKDKWRLVISAGERRAVDSISGLHCQ
ncbi:MAG: GmrSD restriction endonuclease domain-containing protein [Gemmatimonadales bacterium]